MLPQHERFVNLFSVNHLVFYYCIFRVQFLSDDATEYSGFALSWYSLDVNELTPHFNCSFDGPVALCPGMHFCKRLYHNSDFELRNAE